MNEVLINRSGVDLDRPAVPAEAEHYMTWVGGLAACPTGGAYWKAVQTQTPVEVLAGRVVKNAGPLPGLHTALVETHTSFNLSALIGPAIAERVVSIDTCPMCAPRCGFEELRPAQPKAMGTHFLIAAEDWAETLRVVEQTEQASAREEPGPRAWEAFKDLGEWLDAKDEEVAEAVGIGRTTVYSWQREDREPRRGTARKIYELHAAVRSLRRRLGAEGLWGWLVQGEPNRRQMIIAGNAEALSAAIDAALFSSISQPDLAAGPPDRGAVDPISDAEIPRPRRRKARRAKLR
jgi:DNA-binding XRE family transcriptional regulator